MRFRLPLVLLVTISAVLAACTAPIPDATVEITSHAASQTVYGSRTVVVTANLTGAKPDALINVQSDARSVVKTRTGDLLEVTIELKDHSNTVTVSVANPGQALPATATLNFEYPFLTLGNTQAAAVVIGQPDFDSYGEAAPEKRFSSPYLRPAVVNGVLYLPDYSLGRVMGYLQVPTENGAAADFVIGKQDFDDNVDTVGPATLDGPQTVATDGERLFIIDYSDDRIVVYNTPPTTSGAAADFVIGQPSLDSSDWGTSSTRLSSPESMIIAGGRLIVADSGNNRVLIWNTVPTALETPADLVLGQPDMVKFDTDSGGAVADNNMDDPGDVWSDGTRLVVADSNNNRVLIWNTFPTTNFEPADIVIGQPDFASDTAGVGSDGMDYPYSLSSNGNQLFVADSGNNRVLVWNSFPTANGQEADAVLGQVDFDSDVEDLSATGLDYPAGVYVNGNQLFVADLDNDRYLIYEGADD